MPAIINRRLDMDPSNDSSDRIRKLVSAIGALSRLNGSRGSNPAKVPVGIAFVQTRGSPFEALARPSGCSGKKRLSSDIDLAGPRNRMLSLAGVGNAG
jgi:hypothetical protein